MRGRGCLVVGSRLALVWLVVTVVMDAPSSDIKRVHPVRATDETCPGPERGAADAPGTR